MDFLTAVLYNHNIKFYLILSETDMKKSIISVILFLAAAVCVFTSCGKDEKTAATVGGAEVTSGVYTYYLDLVLGNPEDYGVNEKSFDIDVKSAVDSLLKEYVAVNTMSSSLGLSLPFNLKTQVAEETDNRWELFSRHYEKAGITKQDIYKIVTNSALKTNLLNYYYAEDSDIEPTSEKKLKKAFIKEYIGVKIIAASLSQTDTLGNKVSVSDTELSSLRKAFNSMAARANSGVNIEKIYSDYNSSRDLIGTESLSVYIFTQDSAEYGKNFFETISKLDNNEATVFEKKGDAIYLLYRVDISGDDYDYYYTHKTDVLMSLKSGSLDKRIEKVSNSFTVTENSDETKKIYKKVSQLRSSYDKTVPADKTTAKAESTTQK